MTETASELLSDGDFETIAGVMRRRGQPGLVNAFAAERTARRAEAERADKAEVAREISDRLREKEIARADEERAVAEAAIAERDAAMARLAEVTTLYEDAVVRRNDYATKIKTADAGLRVARQYERDAIARAEAAEAKLAAVEAERDKAREALAPFADVAEALIDIWQRPDDHEVLDPWPITSRGERVLLVSDFRRARALTAPAGGERNEGET